MRMRTKNSNNTATIEIATVQNPTVKLFATESFENFHVISIRMFKMKFS